MNVSIFGNITVHKISESEEEFSIYVTVIRFVWIPIWSLILCFGLLGNALTVVVLHSRRLRTSSSCFYLIVLAITDILYLLTSLLASIIKYIFLFPSEVRQQSAFLCVLTPFLHYTLAYISVWLLVAVTVERAIWVVLPFNARRLCTELTAKITVACFILGFTLTDLHFIFFTMKYVEVPPGQFKCTTEPFADSIFPVYDLLFAALLPCAIMLIANCLIGFKLRAMRKFRKSITSRNQQNCENSQILSKTNAQTDTALEVTEVDEHEGSNVNHQVTARIHDKSSPSTPFPNRHAAKEKSTYLTKMLVSTNIFFIVSVTPLLVYDLVYFAVDLRQWAQVSEELRGAFLFGLETMVYTLWYTNFAIHFLLYCLSGPPFRAEAFLLLQKITCLRKNCISQNRASKDNKQHPQITVPQVNEVRTEFR